MYIEFGDTSRKAQLGDEIELQGQTQDVVECQESGVMMLNIDADELRPGDLRFIKALGLTISNPETEEPIALEVEVKRKSTLGSALAGYFVGRALSRDDDEDDDSSFFSSGSFRGSTSFGGFGGGFGGFGGGGFSGGGATRGF